MHGSLKYGHSDDWNSFTGPIACQSVRVVCDIVLLSRCSCLAQRDEWQLRSSMNTRRSAMSIAVHGHDVHIIGGYDGSSSLYTVEVCVE